MKGASIVTQWVSAAFIFEHIYGTAFNFYNDKIWDLHISEYTLAFFNTSSYKVLLKKRMNVHFYIYLYQKKSNMAKLQKSIDKRNALIKATIGLVINNGFHATPMSKIAKMAEVSPATIYLYFENKQDLVNKTYIEVKADYTKYAFATFDETMSVEEGFETIWKRIAAFKLKECENAMFLAQCDNAPMIDAPIRQEGIKHLQPLLDLWERGKTEGIIKPISDYLLYAYTITPLSFLMISQNRGDFKLDETHLEEAYQSAWSSIKTSK
ncbi:TetR family transcriptional regulator [Gelidibacter algens]|uniref:TetR family transcriptional regulator n=2 Tax=Gelidibacter algens TaxID=49280 RepID=A0A327SGD8_9FLAO|nr:TetR family transcriptional regulator [Gelidibacter algens]